MNGSDRMPKGINIGTTRQVNRQQKSHPQSEQLINWFQQINYIISGGCIYRGITITRY